MKLRSSHREVDLSAPIVMGVLNVTPDSFSDGGLYTDAESAIVYGRRMIEAGARIVDVGGESTRPGAEVVPADEEIRRVVSVVRGLAANGVFVSVDTSKPEVMAAAVAAGASLINDVRALRNPGALQVAVQSGASVCLMHMPGDPRTMQREADYTDVVSEVVAFLAARVAECETAGIERDQIVIDPGIGFGKLLNHNVALLAALPRLTALGLPVLIGASRKSMLGKLTGRTVHERLSAGVAVATAAVLGGAKIIRTHDVEATVDAIKVAQTLRAAGYRAGEI
jgi:dihydropteroate synthase